MQSSWTPNPQPQFPAECPHLWLKCHVYWQNLDDLQHALESNQNQPPGSLRHSGWPQHSSPKNGDFLSKKVGLSLSQSQFKSAHIQHQRMRLIRWCARSKGAGSKQGFRACRAVEAVLWITRSDWFMVIHPRKWSFQMGKWWLSHIIPEDLVAIDWFSGKPDTKNIKFILRNGFCLRTRRTIPTIDMCLSGIIRQKFGIDVTKKKQDLADSDRMTLKIAC